MAEISTESTYEHADARREPGPAVTLSLSVFGNVRATFGNRPVELRSRKARALLAYMALSETGIETRERLVGLLWSESEDEKARASLRQTLRELRRIFATAGCQSIRTDKLNVTLDKRGVDVDVWTTIRDVENHRVPPPLLNVGRLTESLLEGLDDLDSAFRVWLLARRQTLHDRLVRALEAGLASDEVPAATKSRMAAAVLNLDPTHEEACRYLMRARAEAGDVAGALRVYKTLWELLDDEYGMEPSMPTQQLVAQIKNGTIEARRDPLPLVTALPATVDDRPAAAWRVSTVGRSSTRVALSVGPFRIDAIGKDKIHVVEGFRHHLIACLVRFREWYVTERPVPPQTEGIMSRLTAQYAVHATAYQTGDAVNLILTMKELPTDLYIWSERFALQLENWFEAQQAIVRRIAIALNVHLSAERLTRWSAQPDAALQVYDRWLRGQSLILKHHPPDWQRAAEMFHEIIAEMPEFAPAYSSLVQLYNGMHLVHPGLYRDRERQQLALGLAKTATQLDPADSRAHLCLGWAQAMAKQYDQAELNLGLAHDLNENDPWTLISSAHGFAFCGAHERARSLAEQALSLSLTPSQIHWGYQVGIRFLCGDYGGCVDAANRAGTVIPNLPGWKSAALHHLGRNDEAAAEFQHFIEFIRTKWLAPEPPTEEAITKWFLHLFPIKLPDDWERLRRGLASAGATTRDARHHGW